MIRTHIQGKKCLIVTNDKIAPIFLERYKEMIQFEADESLKVGTYIFHENIKITLYQSSHGIFFVLESY